ncbi:MAG: MnhB domain-containing protein [Acidimicrobiia bacterium]|nr:MnhB domain-containing protein [Acidimicrobiia bacterium]
MIRRSFVLDTLIDLVIRTALVFSVFLLFSGHNAPGGGFIAGLVAGITLVLRFIVGGPDAVRSALGVSAPGLLGGGLAIALLTGIAGWLWGDAFLESAKFEVELPVLGVVKSTSALPFDIGVFVVVVGVAAAMLSALGRDEGGDS